MSHQCPECGESKPDDGFYARAKSCKECVKTRVKAYRLANRDHYLAYDKARNTRPDRAALRATYAKTDKGRQVRSRALNRWSNEHPDRIAASRALNNAVRDGRVSPWPICAMPGCERTRVDAHHPDYSRPLDVVWLCTRHHHALHLEFLEVAP